MSRSHHIREYLSKHPDSSPKQIVEALAAQGIEVKVGLASLIKQLSKGNTVASKIHGWPFSPVMRKTAWGILGALSAADLLEAKRLVDGLG